MPHCTLSALLHPPISAQAISPAAVYETIHSKSASGRTPRGVHEKNTNRTVGLRVSVAAVKTSGHSRAPSPSTAWSKNQVWGSSVRRGATFNWRRTRSHAHTLARSHARTLTRSHAHTLVDPSKPDLVPSLLPKMRVIDFVSVCFSKPSCRLFPLRLPSPLLLPSCSPPSPWPRSRPRSASPR